MHTCRIEEIARRRRRYFVDVHVGRITTGDLPPIPRSRAQGVRGRRLMILPTSVEPVKATCRHPVFDERSPPYDRCR